MTTGVLLSIAVLSVVVQDIFRKIYNKNSFTKISSYGFNLILVASAILVYIPSAIQDFRVSSEMIIYALCFSVSYFCTVFFQLKAIEIGSLSLTALITSSYALIIPTFYSVIFQDETLKSITAVGVILLFISLYFIGTVKEKILISKKWILYVVIAFFANGLCATIQRAYQLKSGGECKSEFMIIALGIIAVALLIVIFAKEKNIPVPQIKNGGIWAVLTGISNGVTNMLLMFLSTAPSYIVYPTISGGAIVVTFIISRLFFKEKLSKKQNIGFVIGVIAVVLLNL